MSSILDFDEQGYRSSEDEDFVPDGRCVAYVCVVCVRNLAGLFALLSFNSADDDAKRDGNAFALKRKPLPSTTSSKQKKAKSRSGIF